MRKTIAAAALAMTVAGCVTNPLTRDYQREADVSCRAIGASLTALAPHRALLPPAMEATVQRVRVEAEPLCLAPSPPRGSDIADRLLAMAADLIATEEALP